jgi:hypothetical protein
MQYLFKLHPIDHYMGIKGKSRFSQIIGENRQKSWSLHWPQENQVYTVNKKIIITFMNNYLNMHMSLYLCFLFINATLKTGQIRSHDPYTVKRWLDH